MTATASNDTGAAVVAERLAKRFDGATALDDVSLTVNRGELFGVIGPDGAGKTTLFRILTTLLVPDGGSARVLGVDVVAGLWELRRRVGYMPGRFSLYPDLSVEENLRFFASVFGTTIEREYDHIAPIYSQLEPFNGRRAAALSGGMKQKLALCCALVHRPEILFLDEPTTGVDAVSRREFWELLARLRTDGLTIVVSTPYMDEANRCGRVALVQQGRVLTVDSPAAITAAFGRPLLAVRSSNRYATLRALDGYPNAERAYPFGDVMHLVDRRSGVSADELARDAAAYLHGRGIADAVVSEAAPTIEDAFIDRMGAPEGEAAIARGAA
jgi:ABC-2 type transport system ATP-binding protein